MINNNKNLAGKGFDRITSFYDVMACVFSFNRINISQLAFLSHLSTQKTALLLGGGTGHFLQKLLEQNKDIHITYVEVSGKMLYYAKKRIKKNKPDALHRVTFVCADVEDLEWERYDLIVCNYFLDLFDNSFVEVLSKKFKDSLTPQGLLYVTDFNIPETNGLLKWSTETGLKVLYSFFRWTTQLDTKQLPDIEQLLKEQHFYVSNSKVYLGGILMCRLYRIDNKQLDF